MSEPGLNGDRLIDLSRYTHKRGDNPYQVIREVSAMLDFLCTLASVAPHTPLDQALLMATRARKEAA